MSKKDAVIYQLAAKRLKDHGWGFACNVIDEILGADKEQYSAVANAFASMFKPYPKTYLHSAWGAEWDDPLECRILALCFAAAMAETGDL